MARRFDEDDDEEKIVSAAGGYRQPDRDFWRRQITSFGTVQTMLENSLYVRGPRDARVMQPHFSSLRMLMTPYAHRSHPADGICSHFLKRGLIKERSGDGEYNKYAMNFTVSKKEKGVDIFKSG
jgi:hypothetical protein